VTAPARIPEHITDPDEIDRWLEDRDARTLQAAAVRDAADTAVMAAVPRHRPHPDAVSDPDMAAAITARIAYDRKPWWERCRLTLKGDRPAGYVNRHPNGRWDR
jgi:hypothetical protein